MTSSSRAQLYGRLRAGPHRIHAADIMVERRVNKAVWEAVFDFVEWRLQREMLEKLKFHFAPRGPR